MEWNNDIVVKLNGIFYEKYASMFGSDSSPNTDRKNRSAIWNKYLKNYDIKVIRNDVPGQQKHLLKLKNEVVLNNLIDLINFQNEKVVNSLIIRNPDRYGQWILISRDMAERILAIGMI